jgi:hypothetical protein
LEMAERMMYHEVAKVEAIAEMLEYGANLGI